VNAVLIWSVYDRSVTDVSKEQRAIIFKGQIPEEWSPQPHRYDNHKTPNFVLLLLYLYRDVIRSLNCQYQLMHNFVTG